MQSKMIDVNTAVMLYRSKIISAMEEGNKPLAKFILTAMNNLLPQDYMFVWDTDEAKIEREGLKQIACKSCNNSIILNHENEVKNTSAWSEYNHTVVLSQYIICDKCNNSQSVHPGDIDTMYKIQERTRFLAESPSIDSLFDNSLMNNEYWSWVRTTLAEIERRHTEYRHDAGFDRMEAMED